MKSVVAYYLLFFYILATCKPVLPIITDLIAHGFNKSEHISTVHHHNGEHHVHQEITDAAGENEQHNTSTPKLSEPVTSHLAPQLSYNFFSICTHKQAYYTGMFNTIFTFLDKFYPPPKFC